MADKKGRLAKKTAFSARIGNGTREVTDDAERHRYIARYRGRSTST